MRVTKKMQAEERIKELIIAKYGNVRAFATESHSTRLDKQG